MKAFTWQTDLEALLDRKREKVTDPNLSPRAKAAIKADIRIIENFYYNVMEEIAAQRKEADKALVVGEKLYIICLQHGISNADELVAARSLAFRTKENQEMQKSGERIIPEDFIEYFKTKGITTE